MGKTHLFCRSLALIVAAMTLGCRESARPSATSAAALMHAADKDVIATMEGSPPLSTMLAAIQAAGLVDDLSAPGPFTVFAPTNDAFASLSPDAMADLLSPDHKDRLRAVLLHHVHAGVLLSADVGTASPSTLQGSPLSASVRGGTVLVGDAKMVKPDVICTNGVIHWIDKVVLPPPPGT